MCFFFFLKKKKKKTMGGGFTSRRRSRLRHSMHIRHPRFIEKIGGVFSSLSKNPSYITVINIFTPKPRGHKQKKKTPSPTHPRHKKKKKNSTPAQPTNQ